MAEINPFADLDLSLDSLGKIDTQDLNKEARSTCQLLSSEEITQEYENIRTKSVEEYFEFSEETKKEISALLLEIEEIKKNRKDTVSPVDEEVEIIDNSTIKYTEDINASSNTIKMPEGDYEITQTGEKYTVSTPEGDTVELSDVQGKIVSKNHEAIVGAVKFNQTLTEVNCDTLLPFSPKIIKMIQNHSGSAMEVQDGDYMKDAEIILFLSSIVWSIKDRLPKDQYHLVESLKNAPDLQTAKGLFMAINGDLGNDAETNQFGDSKIAGLFLEEFDFRGDIAQEDKFQKALNQA